MTVYIVTSGYYSDYHIDRIFTDENAAKVYCANKNDKENDYDEYIIEEHETSYKYMFFVGKNGGINRFTGDAIYSLKSKNEIIPPHDYVPDYHIIVYLDEPDAKNKALKIAKDMWAEYKANVVGGLL